MQKLEEITVKRIAHATIPLIVAVGALIHGDSVEAAADHKVEVCHVPPGNPDNPITILIPEQAVAAHLAHGDFLGSCDGPTQTGPFVDPPTSPTTDPLATITGTGLAEGSLIRVEGGVDTVEQLVGADLAFAVSIELHPNKVNHLLVTELFLAGGTSTSVALQIIHDNAPPEIFIDFPADGFTLSTQTTTVVGRVGDMLSGFAGLAVTVNGMPAIVDIGIGTNGTYSVDDVPLNIGQETQIVVEAMDGLGNEIEKQITVTYEQPTGHVLSLESGSGQSAQVGQLLPNPLVVKVTNALGAPFVGKVVTFTVTKSNGRVSEDGQSNEAIILHRLTDAGGFATAFWRVGSDAGCGNNRVAIASKDIAGTAYAFASATPAPPTQINVGSGNEQIAEVSAAAGRPLRAWVSDSCNGVLGVPVTFDVIQGDGWLSIPGEGFGQSATVVTGETGHAEVHLFTGPEPGNNRVRATFPTNTGNPATFTVFARATDQLSTSFAGQVLDNSYSPVGGAVCTLDLPDGSAAVTTTSADGGFSFDDIASSGLAHLFIDGTSASTIGGDAIGSGERLPTLSYEVQIIPNARNSHTRPILLPRLQTINDVPYDGSTGIQLSVNGVEGLAMTIQAGSMTIPAGALLADGSALATESTPTPSNPLPVPVLVSLNQVHVDDIPMQPEDGVAPPFAWTLQPGEATFDPPVSVTYPNIAGLPPGAVAYFLSFNHDTSRFDIVASGSTSPDGSTITSDPDDGIAVAGWGCNCPPYAVTGDCDLDCPYDGPSAASAAPGAEEGEDCECDEESIQEAIDLFQNAKAVLAAISLGPVPYAANYVDHYLSGSGSSLIWGPLDQPGIDTQADADYAALLNVVGNDIQEKVNAAVAANPQAPVINDYIVSLNILAPTGIKLNTTWDLMMSVNGIQTANSFVVVSDVDITPMTGSWIADVDFDFFDVYSFDGIGMVVPFIEQAGMLLEKCGVASKFTTNIRVGLVMGSPGASTEAPSRRSVPSPGTGIGLFNDDEKSSGGGPLAFDPVAWEQAPRTLTINGQSTLVASALDVELSNVSAADLFGPAGPGSAPDFLSDDAMRAVVVVSGPQPVYVFTDPFQIESGQTYGMSRWTASSTAPPLPVSISIDLVDNIIVAGASTSATAQATLEDGSVVDVTPATSWNHVQDQQPRGRNGRPERPGFWCGTRIRVHHGDERWRCVDRADCCD